MGKTDIHWTTYVWNPTTGCSHVSPGCEHCYAETLSLRRGWSTKPWVRKAWESRHVGATTVLLVPSRTDTRWWHAYVVPAATVRWIRGRLTFAGQAASDPFPVCIVIFTPEDTP